MNNTTTDKILSALKGMNIPLPEFITQLKIELGIAELPKVTVTYYPTDEEAEALFALVNRARANPYAE